MSVSIRIDADAVLRAYVACALRSTNADHLDPEGTGHAGALDAHFGIEDMAPETLASMEKDIASFLEANADDCALWADELGVEQIGHDLWLTRNRHGAGFWDRFYANDHATPEAHAAVAAGQRLTRAAEALGSSDLYAGDDGRLYVS